MLNRVYELETAIMRSTARTAELKEAAAQAKYALREANIAQVEYSGIRVFLDKLSGKFADKEESLARDVRKAETERSLLEQQLEAQSQQLSELLAQRAALPPLEQLRTQENREKWLPLETRYCAEAILPVLTRLEEALTQYRQMLRGEIPMLSLSQQQAISAAPIALAEECSPLLQRLEAAGTTYGDFFRSPAGFLAAAARHNQLNRAVDADTQIRQLKNQLHTLLRDGE